MTDQYQLLLLIGAVSLGAWWVVSRLMNRGDGGKLRERLTSKVPSPLGPVGPRKNALKELFQKIGQACAKPFMPETREKQGALRKKLGQAGIYAPSAIRTVTGCKFLCLFVGVGGGLLVGLANDGLLLAVSIGGLTGYALPTLWLRRKIKQQQKALDYGLPDALDLMVVCVEAGLAIDAAMQRVAQDLTLAHPSLSREMEVCHMETRVGLSRTEALRNLGTRTANVALQSLASMIIQAERFGTSIATALRVHSDSLRVARQHKAEEMAAKASVKLSLPLVMFIFPSTFIVLAGPTVIQLMNSPLFN